MSDKTPEQYAEIAYQAYYEHVVREGICRPEDLLWTWERVLAETPQVVARWRAVATTVAAATLREYAELVDRGPTAISLPPSVFSTMARERADDLDEAGAAPTEES